MTLRYSATHFVGVNHVRGEKNPGILPRRIAHVAHKTAPTKRPKRRLVSIPHACQSQSPAQEFVDDAASANAEGTDEKEDANTLDEVDPVDVDEIEVDDEALEEV